MTRDAPPRGPGWLIDRFVDEDLADDIKGELEARWQSRRRSRLASVLSAYRLALSVAWHATRDRRRSLIDNSAHRSVSMLSSWPSLRLAVRRWIARPGLALAAVAILALGLGATTSIYSIVDAVLLRPAPWSRPHELVDVYVERPGWSANPVLAASASSGQISWPMLRTIQQNSRTLSEFAAWRSLRQTLNGSQNEPVRTLSVTAGFLPMLGVVPVRGRFFTTEEDDASSDAVLLSWNAWHRRYGGREDIVGQSIAVDEQTFRVVGVLPRDFRFGIGDPPEVVFALGRTPLTERTDGNHFLNAVGRLAPGATIAQATQELHPWISGKEGLAQKRARVIPLDADRRAPSQTPLLILLGSAGLLLLVAVANVAALLLGDATSRRQEIAIRAALGGTRGQVARQLFLENFVLAAVATGAGLFVAIALTPVLLSLAPAAIPFADTVRLDARVFSFSVVLAVATALLFGVLPSVSMAGADPASALRDGGRGGSPERVRGFRWVVAAQVALATILLVGAGLLVETVRQLTSLSLGFNAHGLVVATLRLPATSGATPEERAARRAQRTQTIIDALSTSSGVSAATATSTAPFSGGTGSSGIQIPGKTFEKPPVTHRHIVTDSYFATLGIPMLKGRGFEPQDGFGAHVAVVTDEFERVLLDGDAVGRRFVLNGDEHTVVGVIKAAKHQRYTDEPQIAMYALLRQLPQWATNTIIARTERDAALMVPEIRRAIIAAEPQASFITLETMDDMTRRSIGDERYRAQLTAAFGVIAVLLCSIGLYGLVARSVSDRRRELGVRLALGADPVSLRRLVLQQALGVVAFGLAAGVPAALLVSYSLRGLLFGVPPASPLIVLLASGAIAIAATTAAFGPALRAGRTDPIEALRG